MTRGVDEFKLILSPKAVKDLDSFSVSICKKIATSMQMLKKNPFPRGKLIKKIKGKKSDYYRLRTDKYRVFYMIKANKVIILKILSKEDAKRFVQHLN